MFATSAPDQPTALRGKWCVQYVAVAQPYRSGIGSDANTCPTESGAKSARPSEQAVGREGVHDFDEQPPGRRVGHQKPVQDGSVPDGPEIPRCGHAKSGRTQWAGLRDVQNEAALRSGGDEKAAPPQRDRSGALQSGQSVLNLRFLLGVQVQDFFPDSVGFGSVS